MKLQKITQSTGRHYDDACATAHALDLIGDRWALLVIRELMFGPRRFSDLRGDLNGISANVLTQRLEQLEAAGIVLRRKLPPPASVQVYELTEWGLEVEPVILAIGRWGVRSPLHDPTLPLSAVGLMMSFRAKFEPERAKAVDVSLAFRFGPNDFHAVVVDGRLQTGRGAPDHADVSVSGDPGAFAGLAYAKLPLADLESAGALSITGDRRALARFVRLWEMPPKAPLPAVSAG